MASWDEEKPRHGILDMKQCDIYYPDDHHYTDPDDPNHNWNNMQGTDLNLPYGLSSRLPNPHPFTFNVEMSTVDEEGLIRNRSYRPTSPFARKKSHTRRLRWSDGSGRGEVALANDPADKTFPTSGEKDRDYVIRLIKAMMAMSKAQDSLAVKQQWAKNIKEKISPTVVFTAWQILESCKRRQCHSEPFTSKWQYDNFEDRFQSICEAVQTQKSVCIRALRPSYMETVIENPVAAVECIRNNRKVNLTKKEQLQIFKERMERPRRHGTAPQPASSSTRSHKPRQRK